MKRLRDAIVLPSTLFGISLAYVEVFGQGLDALVQGLAPVYDWFTEGFDIKDLQEAKSLLGEVAQRRNYQRVVNSVCGERHNLELCIGSVEVCDLPAQKWHCESR